MLRHEGRSLTLKTDPGVMMVWEVRGKSFSWVKYHTLHIMFIPLVWCQNRPCVYSEWNRGSDFPISSINFVPDTRTIFTQISAVFIPDFQPHRAKHYKCVDIFLNSLRMQRSYTYALSILTRSLNSNLTEALRYSNSTQLNTSEVIEYEP